MSYAISPHKQEASNESFQFDSRNIFQQVKQQPRRSTNDKSNDNKQTQTQTHQQTKKQQQKHNMNTLKHIYKQ